MKPTLAQLEAFHWTAQLGSVLAAAERLHMSPPAISVRIRMLEEGLGRKLFERRGRRLAVTPAGAALLSDAEQIVGLAFRISEGGSRQHIRLRLGAVDSFAMVCLPKLLQFLERDYPELKVDISVDNSLVLNRRLDERELDLAFLSVPEVGGHLQSRLLGRQQPVWVASPRLGLGRRPVRPRDLAGLQVFTNPQPSALDDLVRDWFGNAGLDPTRLSTCNSLKVIQQLTVSGAGVSLLPMPIMRSDLRSGRLEALDARPAVPPQRMLAAYRADIWGLDVTRFIAIARSVMSRTRFLVD
jgi:DNA-binding transcriptional LysR family regulator